ncbi:helix-turn-helix transcriptional regulator [filamentous cyanobacterium LEGE 11480]|uniref:Helix-turn-helix transcriptional regulator n=1 Tax=Romeriopsis navalis LEGE 11480 TaxID=2777977 RepID=A0A928Z778_9CYAN|nr:AraC family transcriptional regulator [Romeriopsis navalis]MBE9032945.1 helix-turn-helix transcriptional regulator [Romeriopsis navalis LEGE 11480]
MAEQILRNYQTSRAGTSNPFPQQFQLSSSEINWPGIQLCHEVQPACESPKFHLEDYRLAINVGQPAQINIINNGKAQSDTVDFRDLSIMQPSEYVVGWAHTVEFLTIDIQPDFLARQAEILNGKPNFELQPHFSTQDHLIFQIGRALQTDLQNHSTAAGSRLYAETMRNVLTMHLLRHYSSTPAKLSNRSHQLSKTQLQLVTDYIAANLTQDLSLQELAAIAQLNQYQFSRMFKASIGTSPYRYVIQQRIEHAKQLLQQGNLPTSEIALICGFSHQSHLNRHFKQITGVTPKVFLRQA